MITVQQTLRWLIAAFSLGLVATPAGAVCAGDCDDSGVVEITELVRAVNISLGTAAAESCTAVDTNGNTRVSVAELVVAVNRSVNGCGGAPTIAPTATAPPAATPSPTPDVDGQLPPTEVGALLSWLQAGAYSTWMAEGRHPGSGPHFGAVRTFVNDALFSSLDAQLAEHPAGAAAVKELFGSGSSVRGWSVTVKVADGDDGDAWYWFEHYNGNTYAAGRGAPGCTGCHAGGTDFVCTPFPLQPGDQVIPARCP